MSNASSNNAKENTSQAEEEQPEGCEYACNYCQKKFSNKQALGGHQNAHKIERSVEKSRRGVVHKNQFGYFSGHSSYPMIASPYSSESFYGSQEPANNPYHSHYAPRFNHPAQFAPPPPTMHYGSLNACFPTVGNGGSNVRVRPIMENFPFVNGSRVVLSENLGGQINNEANLSENQQPEDSNLDLSLRL